MVKEGGSIVVPRLRPLRYPSPHAKDRAPVEKGIDVQLALAVAEAILTDAADVAVLFTHDTDLLPAVEMVARLKGPRRIETASWSSGKFAQRLREIPGVHHHRIARTAAFRSPPPSPSRTASTPAPARSCRVPVTATPDQGTAATDLCLRVPWPVLLGNGGAASRGSAVTACVRFAPCS
jgi:hypothetical protein